MWVCGLPEVYRYVKERHSMRIPQSVFDKREIQCDDTLEYLFKVQDIEDKEGGGRTQKTVPAGSSNKSGN